MVCYMLCGADRLWLPGRTVGFVGAFAIGGRLGEAFLVRISDSSMSAVTQTDPLSTSGKTGRQSLCFVHADWILKKVETGLTAQRIYQDLRLENAFTGSYQSVKRYVHRMRLTDPKPVQ